MEKYHGNTVEYWKHNAEENYSETPISVLKYITVLEEQAKQLRIGDVIPRISHFISEIGQEYQADDEAVLCEIKDGNLRFYELDYDFERKYLTPVYVA